jgi:arylsulfatase A-like enzyme
MASFIKPHHPFDPPAPWDEMYDPNSVELLPGWTQEIPPADSGAQGYFPHADLTEASVKQATALYYASISQIDYQVGRMVAFLRERGLYDDTLIVFTSDHGEYLGFHHLLLKSGPMYDPLLRVPLLVKLPGNGQGGAVSDALVCNIDLAPTILKQAGIAAPPVLPGRDLFDLDTGNDRSFVFVSGMGGRYSCRSRGHKLLVHRQPERDAFFDLHADPLEMSNRISDPACQSLIRDHRDALQNWLLFDAPPPVYLDENAPEIEGVEGSYRDRADGRTDVLRYFETQFTRYKVDSETA